jgi:ABC-type glycerol-3-phosphate transport system substrate-binding protein
MNPPLIRASFRLLLASGLLLLLAACGGSQGFTSTSTAGEQVEIGSVTAGVFTSGTLAVSPSTISPGGTASVSKKKKEKKKSNKHKKKNKKE